MRNWKAYGEEDEEGDEGEGVGENMSSPWSSRDPWRGQNGGNAAYEGDEHNNR